MTDIIVRARRSDPETSHQAAALFEKPRAQRSVACVVLMLKELGPMSDFQIRENWAPYWGSVAWSFTLPSKARHWARQQGLVKHVDFGTHQGRKVRLWGIGRDDVFLAPAEKCQCCGQVIRKKA